MQYRDHEIVQAKDGIRWEVWDQAGYFVVSRPSQDACVAWIDKFFEFIKAKNHELPPHNGPSLHQRTRQRRCRCLDN